MDGLQFIESNITLNFVPFSIERSLLYFISLFCFAIYLFCSFSSVVTVCVCVRVYVYVFDEIIICQVQHV